MTSYYVLRISMAHPDERLLKEILLRFTDMFRGTPPDIELTISLVKEEETGTIYTGTTTTIGPARAD